MIAPDRITTELDAALKDYTAGNDCAVRFVTIDQVDMLAEFYLHNRATEAKLAKAVEALRKLHHAVCGETGFAACVRLDSGLAYPWPALDEADEMTRATLAEIEGEK
jgi:hypothetical protein